MAEIKEAASSKMLRAVEAIETAERALREVTAEDLEAEHYGLGATPEAQHKDCQNRIYEVWAHASALKIVRRSIYGDYLC